MQSAFLCEDVLLLCDNEAVLCAFKKWVGQGGKATLATAPDADILREIVYLLTQCVRAGGATFLIKVKSHRGEPINKRAFIPLVLGPLNSLFFFSRGLGRRMHLGVEVTESSTNKQHHLGNDLQQILDSQGYLSEEQTATIAIGPKP